MKMSDRFIFIDIMLGVVIVLSMVVFFNVVGNAIDTRFDNQDRMLCESAKESGNEIYLEKCVCYYGGEDIRCIYKK